MPHVNNVNSTISLQTFQLCHPLRDKFGRSATGVRAKDLAEPPALFSTVEPADACQGALGDCWLIAALAGAWGGGN